jgi:hypothetical protein
MNHDRKQLREARLARWARGARFDRNPLRRGTDRAETGLLIMLISALLVGGPFVVAACGAWAHGTAQRNMMAERASHYQVTATLLTAAARPAAGDVSSVSARWTAPDGKEVTGPVYVTTAMPAGARLPEWVLRDGESALPPLVPSQVAQQADLAMVLAALGYALVLAAGGLLARQALDRRRMAAWDAAWLARGPRGTPRT